MNQNLEELKELLMYSYRKLGYTVTTDKDMLYLRFSPDSQSPAVMVRCANESRPLDRAAVQQMFMEFERMGAQNGCHQYRLVNLSGFEDGCKVFEDYNMALSDASYLRRMNKPGFLDLYAHNEKMYREICSSFETVNKVAAVQATGSGKSLLIAASVRDNAGQQQLVIAPRTNIHAEIARHIPEGVKVDYMTFQMLGLMQAENRLDSLKYDRIYIDEFHHGGATRWGAAIEELLAGNPTAKVLGTTATSEHSHAVKGKRDMAMEMFDKVAGRMDISDALVRHILRTPDYVCMPSSYEAMRKDLLESSEVKGDYVKEAKINQMIDSWEKDMPLHEIIREKLLRTLNKEIPHGTAVVIEEFKEEKNIIRIRAEIFCEKASHKGIIVGKNGAALKLVGTYAREDLEKFLGTKVYLNLWVKVKENWRESAATVGNFGYRDE